MTKHFHTYKYSLLAETQTMMIIGISLSVPRFVFDCICSMSHTITVTSIRARTNVVDSLYTRQLVRSLYRHRLGLFAALLYIHSAHTGANTHTHKFGCFSIRSQYTQTHRHTVTKSASLLVYGHSQWTRQR